MYPSLQEVLQWLLLPIEQSLSSLSWHSRSLTIKWLLASHSLLITLKTHQVSPNSRSSRAPNSGSWHRDQFNYPFSLVFLSVNTQNSKSSFSKYVPQTSRISTPPGNVLEMKILSSYPGFTWVRSSGDGVQQSVSKQVFQVILVHAPVENHC